MSSNTRVPGILIRSGSIPTTALSGGVVSSSIQVVQSLPTGTVSSSAQVTSGLPAGTVSSSGQVIALLPAGTFSSSAQLPTGTVSASSQVSYTGLSNIPAGIASSSVQIKDYLPTDTVSSSAQVTTFLPIGTVSSSAQLPAGTVSASSQIQYTGISNIPTGIVSSSGQVTVLLPANTVSSSAQVTAFLPTGTISSSAQLPVGTVSASNQIDITATTNYTTFSSSLATIDVGQNNRLAALETVTGSYATTGSNTFVASQIISGGLTVTQDLTVLGSASIQYVSQSTLNIGTNIITVNTNTPSVTLGGLAVIDSGSSPQRSGSLLFDSANDQWIFVHQNTAGGVTSSVVMMGPATFNSVGSETTIAANKVLKAQGLEHVTASIMTDDGSQVSVAGNITASGDVVAQANLKSNFSSGDEGGEINLARPQTNSSISGSINIDIYQNRLRIFEAASPNRGGYYDITAMASGVGTNLIAPGSSGTSGTAGSSGTSGANGTSGSSGSSGSSGTSGASGTSGVSGTSGTSGASGTSGTSGANGTSGVSGTSGTSGASGTSGTSGANGTSGTSGAGTISGGSADRVALFSGATSLTSNAGLTYNGSQLTLSGTTNGSTPLLAITATGTDSFMRGVRMLNSGMTNGSSMMYAVGSADSARNMGQFYFVYSSAGSTSNRLSMGLHSVDDVFNIMGTGNVGIGTTSPNAKLEVVGRTISTNLVVGAYGTLNDTTGTSQTLQFGNYSAGAFIASSADSYIYKTSNVLGGLAAGTLILQSRSDTNSGGVAMVVGSTPFPAIYVNSSGNTGIGTSAGGPSAKLHVSGSTTEALFRVGTPASSSILFTTGSARVGINTATPTATFDVRGTAGQLFAVTDSLTGTVFSVNDISGVPILQADAAATNVFTVTGEIRATSEITAYYSDERLKTKVGTFEDPMKIVKSLNGFKYIGNQTAKDFGYFNDNVQVGLSAQEVQAVLPEVVKLAPFDTIKSDTGEVTSKTGNNYLTVDYAKLVPVLIEAIKKQQEEIDELKKHIIKG